MCGLFEFSVGVIDSFTGSTGIVTIPSIFIILQFIMNVNGIWSRRLVFSFGV